VMGVTKNREPDRQRIGIGQHVVGIS
jgi:hypothetical protein